MQSWKQAFAPGEPLEIKGERFRLVHFSRRGLVLHRVGAERESGKESFAQEHVDRAKSLTTDEHG